MRRCALGGAGLPTDVALRCSDLKCPEKCIIREATETRMNGMNVSSPTELSIGRVTVKPAQRQVLVDGRPAALGSRALDVLFVLVDHRDRIVKKDELLDHAWHGLVVEENNLQVQISALRKVLGPQAISTIPGRGYRFTALLEGEVAPVLAWTGAGAADRLAGNLPHEQPPLFGRDDDLRALGALLRSQRLVSLVGAGGIGKTVLAQAAARQARDRFADGVWLVELARLSEPRLIVETLATTLQITLTGEGDPHALARALGDACVLVVVDNCEHVADAAGGVISTLLAEAPNLSVLVTSQEPLRLAQENLYRLSPLRVPAEANLESARTAGAVALFEARARTADPRFTLSNDNVAAVIDVCYRLDGIPLAIELAAVRVPVLGVEGLRERLGARFRILTTGARQGLRRHQTLRAALDWSHGLLTRDEQAVFRRIGIFVGGFGLKAAQQVGRDDQIDDWAALEHLGALVEKSLVALDDAHGEPRYRLLETARAYAREKLDESGERERVARAHAQATLEVFEGALYEEHLLTGSARLQKYLPDLEDARAALDWSQQADERLFVALAGAVAWIWVGAGQRLEGVRCNRAAIAKITRDTPAKLAARLLIEWKTLAWPEEGTKVVPVSAHALELYRSLGDEQALFAALCRHAECLTVGAPVEADRFLDEAGRIWRSDWPAALRLQFFWVRACALHQQGRCEESLAMLEESIRLAKIIGDARMSLRAQLGAEQAVAQLGRWDECVARGHEMVALMTQDRWLRSGHEELVLINLCMALARTGAVEEGLEVARAAAVACERAGRPAYLLDALAVLSFGRDRPEDAARVLGRADRSYQERSTRREAVEQQARDDLIILLRKALQADRLDALLAEGHQLTNQLATRIAMDG